MDEQLRISGRAQGIFAILGLTGTVIALLSTSVYGPGLSPDSVAYIFAARSLLAGDGSQQIVYEFRRAG